MTNNERQHKDRLINSIDEHDDGKVFSEDVGVLICCAELVDEFKVNGVRPSSQRVKEIVNTIGSSEELMKVYFNFFISGLTVESNVFREKALKLTVKNAEEGAIDENEKSSAVGAAVEVGASKDKLISVFGAEIFGEERQKLEGISLPLFSAQDHEKSINEIEYENILKGKKIAILGPTSIDDPKIIDEISKYDVLIFTNGVNKIGAHLKSLSNYTLVSYYNKFNAKKMHYERDSGSEKLSDFCVYREFEYDFQVLEMFSGSARLMFKNDFFFNGAPQALQAILYDLAFFSPCEIKAFGFNLYVSNKPYRKNYSSPTHQILYDLARHDPVGNFVFTKKLYEIDFFKADNELDFVLSLNVDEYLREIERNSQAWS